LQGEGQEFESPRLHQLRAVGNQSGGSDPARGRTNPITEDTGWTPGRPRPTGAVPGRLRGRSSSRLRVSTAIVHLIADLRTELIDQRTAGDRTGNGPGCPPRGQHLENWKSCSAVNRSSISPSQGFDPDREESHPSADRQVRCWEGSSYKGHGVDALAPRADEGRGRLRKASGSREQTLIRRCPNGETRLG
jgi:hypothetical protein